MIVLCCAALPQYLRAKKSAQWPSVDGVITASWMRSGLCKGMPCYHGEIEYRYRVGNTDYQSTALSLGHDHWATKEAWQPVLDQYPVGKAVKVYYDPGHPATAILEPGLHGEMELLYKLNLFLIGFFSFAFVVMLLTYHDPEEVYRGDFNGTARNG
jgi:hypothetical protein